MQGFSGEAGLDKQTDTFIWKRGSMLWEEIEVDGSLPFTGRLVPPMIDHKRNVCFVYGGFDGKNPTGLLHEFVITQKVWRIAKVWLVLDDDPQSVKLATTGSKGTVPTPRYGHCIAMDNEFNITVCLGSGSMYLNDVIQFYTGEDEE